ncbi:DUF3443 domain-containing protein [Paraburkholderia sp. UCT31]|uniref:DUF3443 domain-containing protein n=1 Tax=Paraburkholderia sp. UCT31 TaxID=2615209 RepID=UPI0016554F64|nr:DUF3443 domain-containing protein [Paraburkholderia sp. UCT31]MBC8738515.1 DUF3443 domain-containing protein [Paraburkholderia sp. UCT31]
MRKILGILSAVALLSVAACGGGGGGGGGDTATTTSTSTSPNSNVAVVNVEGSLGTANVPYVSVRVCAPGSSNCQTIDHIMVDTGSTGLRVLKSALGTTTLPQTTVSGTGYAECAQFADGVSWGPLATADITLGGTSASNVPVQVIDGNYAAVPSGCSSLGPQNNTQANLGANGILGVGLWKTDCGATCVSATVGLYYACQGTSCSETTMPQDKQTHNPVDLFASDNNGVVLQMPAVADTGAKSVTGSLIFGVATRTNNALGAAQVYPTDVVGNITANYKGTAMSGSFFDSGSNMMFFHDASIAPCSSSSGMATLYCPSSTQQLSAALSASDGSNGSVNFVLANGDAMAASGNAAFSGLGASYSTLGASTFDFGMPVFFGRSVFIGMEGHTAGGKTGPFFGL